MVYNYPSLTTPQTATPAPQQGRFTPQQQQQSVAGYQPVAASADPNQMSLYAQWLARQKGPQQTNLGQQFANYAQPQPGQPGQVGTMPVQQPTREDIVANRQNGMERPYYARPMMGR